MIVWDDGRVMLRRGDCREILRALPEAAVHCVITSPPYWGLRDYGLEPLVWGGDERCGHSWGRRVRVHKGGPTGPNSALEGRAANPERDATKDLDAGAFCRRCGAWRGSLGLEPTPELYVEHLVGIFREVRRVLRPDGVVWLNLGDCYATGATGGPVGEDGPERGRAWRAPGYRGSHTVEASGKAAPRIAAMGVTAQPNRMRLPGLKPKDLVGIPWRAAFALQADGWWLRSDIIWAKGASFLESWAGSVMPESVTDRPTRAHEYLFLLTSSERYYYDADAIRERAVRADEARWDPGTDGHQGGLSHAGTGASTRRFRRPAGWCDHDGCDGQHLEGRYAHRVKIAPRPVPRRPPPQPGTGPGAFHALGRNVRSVWAINPEPFPEAHFATFPRRLVAPCILAGTSERCCHVCGAPWERLSASELAPTDCAARRQVVDGRDRAADLNDRGSNWRKDGLLAGWARTTRTVGWRPTCACYDALYRELPQARRPRTRVQREASGDWWRRARARPGLERWPWATAVVADPFAGACTTLLVAKELGRRGLGVELKPTYCDLGARRLRQEVLPFDAAPRPTEIFRL